jgi:serine protease Do
MAPDVSAARSLQESFNAVAEQVLPVVAEINVVEVVHQNIPRLYSPWDFFFGTPHYEEREYRKPGLGSGVIVRRERDTVYVLSNNHVVGNADEISVRLYDGREFEAQIVGKDERTDLALVSFDTTDHIPVARLGDSDRLEVGDWVLAVGNPYGFESTVTVGIVSALRRRPENGGPIGAFTDYIQTDAAINPGNSGGALVNLNGEVVGINTWIASRSGGSVGLGFAIPVNSAKTAIDDFIEKGRISYGWLGVSVLQLDEQRLPGLAEALWLEGERGALVANVHIGSPAHSNGIVPGDFITNVAGTAISDSHELSRVVGLQRAGTTVKIELIRLGEPVELDVVLRERGPEEEVEDNSTLWPGFIVMPLTDDVRQRLDLSRGQDGVAVATVAPESPAAVAGVRPGDVIEEIGSSRVRSVAEFYEHLNRGDREVDFTLLRQGTRIRLGLRR